jgi:hypothetical protein
VNVDIDCNALLASMMEEASKAVAMVVDLTNESWQRNNDVAEDANISTPTCTLGTNSSDLGSLSVLPGSNGGVIFMPPKFDRHQPQFDLVYGIIREKSIYEDSSEESDVDRTVSAENVTAIVDCVIGEIDDFGIAPPAYKKQRVLY